ncbi:multicopper oxidase domain-containing protein [Paenibacillus motobuensis]
MMLHEFHAKGLDKGIVRPGSYSLDPLSDMFNFFTINGRCYPFTTPLPVASGDRVKLRLANVGMNAHPMHLHGHQFVISASDRNTIALANRLTKNTIPVASGETFDIEGFANNPGIWPFHCHIPHHVANNFTDSTGGMFTTVIYKR